MFLNDDVTNRKATHPPVVAVVEANVLVHYSLMSTVIDAPLLKASAS